MTASPTSSTGGHRGRCGVLFLVVACAFFAGCASTGSSVGGEPASLRVVILPAERLFQESAAVAPDGGGEDVVEADGVSTAGGEAVEVEAVEGSAVDGVDADPERTGELAAIPFARFSQQLASDLEAYGAAVEVQAADVGSLAYERADVRIRPRLSAIGIEPEVIEEAGIAWGSWTAWAFTWIGGLAVRDYSYRYVEVEFDVRSNEDSAPLDAAPELSEYPVSMMERANAWLWCVPCILWPPRWVPDDTERLRASLDEAVQRRAAEELTVFLKHRYEAAALNRGEGSMELVATLAEDADQATRRIVVTGRISSRLRPIEQVVAVVNGRAESLPKDPEASGWHGDVYDYVLASGAAVALKPGEEPETVTVRAAADHEFSRTLRVRRR